MTTDYCCEPKCQNKYELITGNHCCLYCRGHMHAFCGKEAPGSIEGSSQKRICSTCQGNTSSSSLAVASLISPPPSSSSTSTVDKTNETIPEFEEVSRSSFKPYKPRNLLTKGKLPTNLKSRKEETITFNILLLQQIQLDGNLHHALNIKKGGKAGYFKYINTEILPTHYNPQDYQFFTHINLKDKFNQFEKFAIEEGNKAHSTDITGEEGETLDSDVVMYLKMRESDEVPVKKKKNCGIKW